MSFIGCRNYWGGRRSLSAVDGAVDFFELLKDVGGLRTRWTPTNAVVVNERENWNEKRRNADGANKRTAEDKCGQRRQRECRGKKWAPGKLSETTDE